ncbi:MAG: hypothetical protein O3B82_02105 [Bacteroidetes bacterium]|nr:hypothetical protein [Bacteroidota bacterium]
MKMRKKILLLLLLCLAKSFVIARGNTHSQLKARVQLPTPDPRPSWVSMHIGPGYQFNAGNWRARYPSNAFLHAGAEYQHQEKWLLGFDYMPYFSGTVRKDSIYGAMVGPSNYLFDINGNPAIIRTYLRGFNLSAMGGKIFPIRQSTSKNPRTLSFIAMGGMGFHEHYTKFEFDKGRLPQLEGVYESGHDNYRRGFSLSQQFRLQYMNTETLSFTFGIHLMESFTRNMRGWDMGTNRIPDASQFDFAIGLNGGLIIPINIGNSNGVKDSDYLE